MNDGQKGKGFFEQQSQNGRQKIYQSWWDFISKLSLYSNQMYYSFFSVLLIPCVYHITINDRHDNIGNIVEYTVPSVVN